MGGNIFDFSKSAFSQIFGKALSIADNPVGGMLGQGLKLLGMNMGASFGANLVHSWFPMANNVNAGTLAGVGGGWYQKPNGEIAYHKMLGSQKGYD